MQIYQVSSFITYYGFFFHGMSFFAVSEWRSYSWHYFLVQNSSKCKHMKIHQITIKCIVCNKTNNKLVFNPSVENTFVLQTCQISLRKQNSHILHRQIEHWFVLVIISYSQCNHVMNVLFELRHTIYHQL